MGHGDPNSGAIWLDRMRFAWCTWMDNPRPGLPYLPAALILLMVVWTSPPALRSAAPVQDLVADAASSSSGTTPAIVLVDLESWTALPGDDATPAESEQALSARAADRRSLAQLLRTLQHRDDLTIGLDLLLDTTTEAEADAELAAALLDSPRIVVGVSREVSRREDIPPLAEPFTDKQEVGELDVLADPSRRVRRYGIPGREDRSLAAAMLQRWDADRPAPRRRYRLGGDGQAPFDQRGWIRITADGAIGHPEVLPRRSLVLVGLGGREGTARDGYAVRTSRGVERVPGVAVHALAIETLASGIGLGRASLAEATALLVGWLLSWAAVWAGISRLTRRLPRGSYRAAALLACGTLAGLAGLPLAALLADAIRIEFPVGPLMTGPLALLAVAHSGAWIHRRVHYRIRYQAQLGGAPDAVGQPLRLGLTAPRPEERIPALLDAFEELVFYLAVYGLCVDGVPEGRAKRVRAQWHREHTLQTLLATLTGLAPEVRSALDHHLPLGACGPGRPTLERYLAVMEDPGASAADDGGDGTEDADETTASQSASVLSLTATVEPTLDVLPPDENAFILLRNAIAHDTASWSLRGRTAVRLAAALQRQLHAMLLEPEVRHRLTAHRLCLREGESPGDLRAVFQPDAPGDPTRDAAPWITVRRDGGAARLYRYRGVAKVKHWLTRDGRRFATVAYLPYGTHEASTRPEVRVPASGVDEQTDPGLAIGDGEWIPGAHRRKKRGKRKRRRDPRSTPAGER